MGILTYFSLNLVCILFVDLLLAGSWYQNITFLKQQIACVCLRLGEAHNSSMFLK